MFRARDVPSNQQSRNGLQLIDAVMSALALKQGGKWSFEEIKQLWSEESLTAAVLPRYHIDVNQAGSRSCLSGEYSTQANWRRERTLFLTFSEEMAGYCGPCKNASLPGDGCWRSLKKRCSRL